MTSSPTAVLVAEPGDVAESIRLRLEADGLAVHSSSDATPLATEPTVSVFVAATPREYLLAENSVHAYVAAVIRGAEQAASVLSSNDLADRALVLVAPPMSAALSAGPAAISTAQGALRGLSRAWSVELGSRGIRSNVVQPGLLDGDAGAHRLPTISLHRPDEPYTTAQDIANAVAFLASADAGYITGTELDVDGALSENRQSLMSVLWQEGIAQPGTNPLVDFLGRR